MKQRLKILHVIDALVVGGKERQIIELIKGVKGAGGMDMKLVVMSDAIHYDEVFGLDVDIRIMKRKHRKDLSLFRRMHDLCREYEPDIIHSWDAMCTFFALPVAKRLKIRFVNGIVRNSPRNFTFHGSKWWPVIKASFRFSDVNLSNSRAGLRAFRAPERNSRVIRNGFDFGRIASLREKDAVRKDLRVATDRVVGMIGRFDRDKDYRSYVKSAISILREDPDVTFLAVGDGPTRERCIAMVPEEFRARILFPGNRKDVESIVNILDVGVLASYEDGISNAIMEFMALEKPVVATDLGGNREIVLDRVTGFLVKPDDPDALKDRIAFLLRNGEAASGMGRAGRERIETEFSLGRMTAAHVRLYEELARLPI